MMQEWADYLDGLAAGVGAAAAVARGSHAVRGVRVMTNGAYSADEVDEDAERAFS